MSTAPTFSRTIPDESVEDVKDALLTERCRRAIQRLQRDPAEQRRVRELLRLIALDEMVDEMLSSPDDDS